MEQQIDEIYNNLYNDYLVEECNLIQQSDLPECCWEYETGSEEDADTFACNNLYKEIKKSEIFAECETNEEINNLDIKVKEYIKKQYGAI